MRALRQSGLGQIFFGGIVVSIILAFVLQARTGGPSTTLESECAVNVGKTCIDPKDFQAAYGLVSAIGLNEKAVKQLRLSEKIGRGLAEREVLLREATRLGISTSESAVDSELVEGRTRVSLPAEGENQLARSLALCVDGPTGCEPTSIGLRALPVKKDGAFDFERYKKMVRIATSRSPGHFKEMQIQETTAARVRDVVRSQVRVSDEEGFLTLSRIRSEATVRFVRVESTWFEQYFVSPTKEQQEAWSKEHATELADSVKVTKERFTVGCPVVSEILLVKKDDETDEALLGRAKALRSSVQTEGAFEKEARKSSGGSSASLGGRVGCLGEDYGTGSLELLEAAKKLTKPGTVSEPIVTLRGASLLRLNAVVTTENAEQLAREHETYRLTSAALGSEASRLFAVELLDRVSKGETMEAAVDGLVAAKVEKALGKDHPAKSHADRPQNTVSSPFNRDGSALADTSGTVNLTEVIFSLEKPDALVDHVVPLRSGFAVVQLKEKDEYTREKWKTEREKILPQLRVQKAEEFLAAYVARLLEKAGGVTYNPRFVPPEETTKEKKTEKKTEKKGAG
jgi:hypothetical protein